MPDLIRHLVIIYQVWLHNHLESCFFNRSVFHPGALACPPMKDWRDQKHYNKPGSARIWDARVSLKVLIIPPPVLHIKTRRSCGFYHLQKDSGFPNQFGDIQNDNKRNKIDKKREDRPVFSFKSEHKLILLTLRFCYWFSGRLCSTFQVSVTNIQVSLGSCKIRE